MLTISILQQFVAFVSSNPYKENFEGQGGFCSPFVISKKKRLIEVSDDHGAKAKPNG